MLITRFLAILVFSFSAVVNAQAPDEQLTLDIRNRVDADRFDTLLAGERELVLIVRESTTPITKGVAVLLGDAGQGPFSQHGLAPLAEQLNQYGWVTMIMPAPSTAFTPLAEEDSDKPMSPEQNDDAADPEGMTQPALPAPHARQAHGPIAKEHFEQHEQQLIEQMQAIVGRTQDYPGFFLVIASGTTSAWLTKIYAEQKIGSPDALIIISPFWPQRDLNNQLPTWVGDTDMPVMDVYSQWDNEWSASTVSQRNIAAQKAFKMHYRQRELIGQMRDTQQYAFLGKEIYGWLTYMGW